MNRVWENNSPPQNNVQSMDYNTGQSMWKENKETNGQQALNPITESTIGSNTDDNTMFNNASAYAELSHSHLPGHTAVAVNCHDHEYGEIGGSINNVCSTLINQSIIFSDNTFQDLNYLFVQSKRDKSANIAFQLSMGVNRTNYATVLPHLAQPKGTYYSYFTVTLVIWTQWNLHLFL